MKRLIVLIFTLIMFLVWGGPAFADRADGQISWTHDGINTTSYDLHYGKDPTLAVSTILAFPKNQKSAIVEGLDWDETYYFMIKSKGPGGDTDSDIVSAKTPVQPIGAPSKAIVNVDIVIIDTEGNIKTFSVKEVVDSD